MSVYVDDMRAHYRRMVMCHMIADSTDELLQMGDRIGIARRWIQDAGTPYEHFDVSLAYRAKAIASGAVECSKKELALRIRAKRAPKPVVPTRGDA